MSTNSFIGQLTGNTIKGVYCHWDGYPENNLEILKNFYRKREQTEKLVKLGQLSSLGLYPEASEIVKKFGFDYHMKAYETYKEVELDDERMMDLDKLKDLDYELYKLASLNIEENRIKRDVPRDDLEPLTMVAGATGMHDSYTVTSPVGTIAYHRDRGEELYISELTLEELRLALIYHVISVYENIEADYYLENRAQEWGHKYEYKKIGQILAAVGPLNNGEQTAHELKEQMDKQIEATKEKYGTVENLREDIQHFVSTYEYIYIQDEDSNWHTFDPYRIVDMFLSFKGLEPIETLLGETPEDLLKMKSLHEDLAYAKFDIDKDNELEELFQHSLFIEAMSKN